MMCKVCDKRVYEMEVLRANEECYHKTCFKCKHCKRILSLGNFASMEGELFCKPHFLQIFKTKGNYEEGFGRDRHSKLWQDKDKQATKEKPAPVAVEGKGDEEQ